ncbi:MAG TPA: DUF72 domain-containing protein [Candidatus Angelobacter sp.]|nr:DUF72 domain-containing protein [Candidatus Angelobacter sp.]
MLWVGTSGFQYPEWRGSFYPDKLPISKMLPYYAEHFPTTEINYTFRRMPTVEILERWVIATPLEFKFTLKAPQEITHFRRLRDCEKVLGAFCNTLPALNSKLGVVLFQLPPGFARDIPVLADFMEALPHGVRVAFEFRHSSWHDDEVFALFKSKNAALCIADSERMATPIVLTADFGYFRLRDEGYRDADIACWAEKIAQNRKGLRDVFVYFKHEEKGVGAEFAKQLMGLLSGLPDT